MAKTYHGEGNVIDVTLASAAASGDVLVIGNLLGVCLSDGAIGDIVAVAVSGVFDLPAVDGAAFNIGETVVVDVSAGNLIDDNAAVAATGDLTGGCVAMETKTAGTSDTILVKLNVGANTVT